MSEQPSLLGELLLLNGPMLPVLMEDEPLHTPDHPFCFDPTCPCHQDEEAHTRLIEQLHDYWREGLVTAKEAGLLLDGKTV